ncbi:hypothetical protein BEWA_003140 [Theileria equi strain WA]|uniref:Cytidyltransferase-like domain-containing protein n=1 Tax=Theileria equi strain WA TaxID=1537102 RepID=L0B106_THEEQ|nr:hypothetical protein BEWA_003140 [Theileria equi strain WA]AFZ80906.1 hypothetical protein BEWA_003140 [Theileria equi strain WA]|eukprot:XP_004830572.1 hypothetical protein BEWA_003140 [Theileria equi strain WA]
MFMVIRDLALTQLLDKVTRKSDLAIKFRKVPGGLFEKCKNCNVCTVERSLYNVATLISEPLARGCTDLIIYLVVGDESNLYSAILLDYIRSLYSLVILQAQRLNRIDEFVNPDRVNFTILPVADWKVLLEDDIEVIKMEQVGRSSLRSRLLEPRPSDDGSREEHSSPTGPGKGVVPRKRETYILPELPEYTFTEFYKRFVDINPGDGTESWKRQGPLEDTGTIDCLGTSCANLVVEKYENVMCCGTFDRLHFGHKVLLLTAFLSSGRNLNVGITASKEMLDSKEYMEHIEPFEKRQARVTRYLGEMKQVYCRGTHQDAKITYGDGTSTCGSGRVAEPKRVNYHNCDFLPFHQGNRLEEDRCNDSIKDETYEGACSNITIFPLMDLLGPSRYIKEQFAMIVTSEIIQGANAVNEYRRGANLFPWHIILIGFVVRPGKESDTFPKLSSSFIRRRLTI